jgi:hypothetical protein
MGENGRKACNDAFSLNIWWVFNILMAALNNGQFGRMFVFGPGLFCYGLKSCIIIKTFKHHRHPDTNIQAKSPQYAEAPPNTEVKRIIAYFFSHDLQSPDCNCQEKK